MRKTLLTLALAASSLVVAPPATARILDYPDPSGDRMNETVTQSGMTHDRGGDEGDITFVRVSHTATQGLVYMRFRKLSVPQQYAGVFFILEGNNGVARRIVIKTRHGDPQVRLARGCLRNPKYVRMQGGVDSFRFNDTFSRQSWDDPNRNGGTSAQLGKARSPWVVAG